MKRKGKAMTLELEQEKLLVCSCPIRQTSQKYLWLFGGKDWAITTIAED